MVSHIPGSKVALTAAASAVSIDGSCVMLLSTCFDVDLEAESLMTNIAVWPVNSWRLK